MCNIDIAPPENEKKKKKKYLVGIIIIYNLSNHQNNAPALMVYVRVYMFRNICYATCPHSFDCRLLYSYSHTLYGKCDSDASIKRYVFKKKVNFRRCFGK